MGGLYRNAVDSSCDPDERPSMKPASMLLVALLAACGSSSPNTSRYAVGTHLFTGSMLTGSSRCTNDAPAGVLDGSKVIGPGTIKRTCPSGYQETITAEYADHVAITFPKTVKVGQQIAFEFELRNAQDQQLSPTLSEAGVTNLSEGCTALSELGRGGAQDTGRDPFMSAKAASPGSCKVSI